MCRSVAQSATLPDVLYERLRLLSRRWERNQQPGRGSVERPSSSWVGRTDQVRSGFPAPRITTRVPALAGCLTPSAGACVRAQDGVARSRPDSRPGIKQRENEARITCAATGQQSRAIQREETARARRQAARDRYAGIRPVATDTRRMLRNTREPRGFSRHTPGISSPACHPPPSLAPEGTHLVQ